MESMDSGRSLPRRRKLASQQAGWLVLMGELFKDQLSPLARQEWQELKKALEAERRSRRASERLQGSTPNT
jgi:hypothetical protein